MDKDFKIVKFEQFIDNIFKNLKVSQNSSIYSTAASSNMSSIFSKINTIIDCIGSFENIGSMPLYGLIYIYNYNKLNNYGKFIMSHEFIYLLSIPSNFDKYIQLNDNLEKDPNMKYKGFKSFIEIFREKNEYHFKFIFWALMILTVDKTDAEEHLSLICDIAKILNITDDEMKDISYIIKMVYNKEHSNYQIKSERVKETFYGVLNMFK